MVQLAYWVRPVETDDVLGAHPDLVQLASRFASLAFFGHWYRLEASGSSVTCCVPGPLSARRTVLWLSPPRPDQLLRIKRSAALTDPGAWVQPGPGLDIQLSAAVRLAGSATVLAERVQPGHGAGTTHYRVTVDGPGDLHGQMLLEVLPR